MDLSPLAALRRFHLGDPNAPRVPLPPGFVPAVRPEAAVGEADWPLVVDPAAAADDVFATPLGDRAPDALPPGSQIVALDRDAAWKLLDLAARRHLGLAGAGFAKEAKRLAASAEALLAADRARRPGELSDDERAGSLGPLGGRLMDPNRLAGVVARRRAGEALPDERRGRLEAARTLLAGFDPAAATPRWIVSESIADLAAGIAFERAGDPLAAALAEHEEAAAATAELARAARRVLLEESNAFDAQRHEAWLAQVDWRALSREEAALVPPVILVLRESELQASDLGAWSSLLRSGRPLQLVVVADDAPVARPGGATRFEPATFAFGHRDVFVHQGSLAMPRRLAAGFVRGLAGSRPALHVIDAVPDGAAAEFAAVSRTRLAARAVPLLTYEPAAGGSWAKRLRVDDNPALDADWPKAPLAESATEAGAPAEAAVTFADAALLDPAWRTQFADADGAGEQLTPLAVWLELDGEQATRKLPFVWALAPDGTAHRLVVSRALALAARDRRDFWRNLSELAGVRSEHVEAAVESATRQADERAARERADLEGRHAAELARTRAEAVGAAVDRLVASLLDPLRQAPVGEPSGRAAAMLAADLLAAAPGVPAAPAPAPAAAAAPAAAGGLEGDVWIDSALCTSCDECVRKVPAVFAYNSDKQAYVKNPRGGSYRDLVRAAEACPASVIHPGAPWNTNEPGLDSWIERARKFA